MADIDKKQSNEHYQMLPVIAGGCCVVALVIALCFAYQTFFAQTIRVPETINVNIVDAKGHGKELSAEGKAYVKEQLYTALMEVSGKAESAYNEKFAALLTVLSVFGIAWPLILGFLQFRFNEREINKIDESADKITGIEQTAKNAEEQANNAKEQAKKAEEQANNAEVKIKDVEQTAKNAEEQANKAEDRIMDVEQKVEKAKEQANSALEAAQTAYSSAGNTEDIVNELNNFKTNIYNDIPFVYQTLASYFCQILVPPATKENINSFLKYSTFALEMGLMGLYYACLSDNAKTITDLQQKVLNHLKRLDDFMKTNNVSEKQQMSHLNSFNWDSIQRKIKPNVFSEIKTICDNRFIKKGE